MRKYISRINIKNYRQTPEQEQVSLASIPKQENKTDFYLRTHGMAGHLLETTPHNTPPDRAHRRLPTAWNLSRTTVCTKAVPGRRTALFKAERRSEKCAGNDTECYSVSMGHEALSHC